MSLTTKTMKLKKILYILLAIAIIAIVAFVFYQFISRGISGGTTGAGQTGSLPATGSQQFPSSGQSTTTTPGTQGTTATSSVKFGVVSDGPALDYFVNNANVVTIVRPDGTIESIANSATSSLSNATIPNIITASFSYDGKKILVSSLVGTTTRTSVFDIASQKWTSLPDNMESPAWSPINNEIAYLAPSGYGAETVDTINAGAANPRPVTLTTLTMENMLLQWPMANTLILSDRPSAFVAGSIWKFNIPSRALSSVVFEGLGVESIWNASGSALLFSGDGNNAGGALDLQDPAGNRDALSFGTLPSKCVFAAQTTTSTSSTDSIYCAVPIDQSTFQVARLPDEYDQKIYFTNDNFYGIDPSSGSLSNIFSAANANQNIDATDLKIFNNILFFINRYDQKLYAISLL